MFEDLLKLYVMAIHGDVRSPLPHLIGPPGCGKSSVVARLAKHVGHKLRIINVSRISPLELEGVQMPVSHEDQAMRLQLLLATYWDGLQDGDIVLLDEFLRGFPEVYNGMLDILTSREVGGHTLPRVFIIGASNSNITYDPALEDRLLHIPVPDPRPANAAGRTAKRNLAQFIVDDLGLLPAMLETAEMHALLDKNVLPMFDVLDTMGGKGTTGSASSEGRSVRHIIGQAQLRQVNIPELKELIKMNNTLACNQDKGQYVFLLSGKGSDRPPKYDSQAKKLVKIKDQLTEVQARNLTLNLQLVEMEMSRQVKGVGNAANVEPEPEPF